MNWLRSLHEATARRELAGLRDRLLPTVVEPGLLAAIDQHAAAIRDILGLTAGGAGLVELAAYARGVRDAATDHGWQANSRIDWVTIRLLAAVSLAPLSSADHPAAEAEA